MTPAIALELDPGRTKLIYEWDAQQYLQSLPLEHFMESTAQATQRKITVESFDVIERARPDIQCFSELLIQYLRPGQDPDKPARVVPDNMVFVRSERIEAEGSFMVPVHRFGPTLILEYVSKSNERKDYQDNYKKYEEELKVPYYLVFHPDNENLRVFRMVREKYLELILDSEGRFAIPDLELEAGLLDGWVRFWFRGELVPLPGDLVDEVEEQKRLRSVAERRAVRAEGVRDAALQEKQVALQEKQAAEQRAKAAEAELARLREELTRKEPKG